MLNNFNLFQLLRRYHLSIHALLHLAVHIQIAKLSEIHHLVFVSLTIQVLLLTVDQNVSVIPSVQAT